MKVVYRVSLFLTRFGRDVEGYLPILNLGVSIHLVVFFPSRITLDHCSWHGRAQECECMNCLVREMVPGRFEKRIEFKNCYFVFNVNHVTHLEVRGLNELQQGFKGELTMSEHMEQLADAWD